MMSMMRDPKVSVCIPTFNSERYLAPAIESVLAQTFEDFNLILCDDLSSDTTLDICNKYAQMDSRVEIVHIPFGAHVGLFRNYNRCMSAARGEYIKLLAHDDMLDPDALALMVPILEEFPQVAVVGCKRKLIDADAKPIGVASAFDHSGRIDGAVAIAEALNKLDNNIGDPTSMLFRRHFVNAQKVSDDISAGFNPDFVFLNLEFWCRLFSHGDYYHLDTMLCSQRQHAHQRGNALVESLLYIADYQLLSEECRHLLKRAGIIEENWQRRVNQIMIDHVNYRLRDTSLSEMECKLAAEKLIAGSSPEWIAHSMQRYAALNYWSMTELSNALQKLNALKSENQAKAEEIASLRAVNGALLKQLHNKTLSKLPGNLYDRVSKIFSQH